MTTTELRDLLAQATPGEWSTNECSAGGLILLRDGILQTHLQVVPAADAELITAIRNEASRLLDVVEAAERLASTDRDDPRISTLYSVNIEALEGFLAAVAKWRDG